MAEFCNQCAKGLGISGDFKNMCKHGWYQPVLCEGCGNTLVNNLGDCVAPDCLRPGHNVPPYDDGE